MRISVEGGGCSGFRYDFALVADTNDDDLVIEKARRARAIDPVSVPFMAGSEIDFVDDLIGRVLQDQQPERDGVLRLRHVFSV